MRVNTLESGYWHCQHLVLLGRHCAICKAEQQMKRRDHEIHRAPADGCPENQQRTSRLAHGGRPVYTQLAPRDDDTSECPVCDAYLRVSSRDLAACDVCGWVDEPDWGLLSDPD